MTALQVPTYRYPDSDSLRFPGSLTFDAWINTTGVGTEAGGSFYADVLRKRHSDDGGLMDVGIGMVDNVVRFFLIDDAGTGTQILGTTIINDGRWHHIAGVRDTSSGEIRLFVDGLLEVSLTDTTGTFLEVNAVPWNIGNMPGGGVERRPWDGLIDEVEIFNRALLADEIRAIYDAGGAGKIKPEPIPPPAGMVSWWPGDGNANDIIDGNPGTLQGGAAFAPGKVGQTFSFDGTDDFVEVPDNPNLRITDVVTIDFWAKRREFSIDIVLEKGGDWNFGETNYGIGLHSANGNMFYFYYDGGWRGTTGVSDFNWHHYAVVAVHGDVDPILYIDGVQEPVEYQGGSGNINLFPSTRPLHIGAQVNGPTDHYGNLLLDEVEIFNRALTEVEIRAIYEAGSAGKIKPQPIPPPAGMVSWWPGDGNANDIVDGNPGTLQSGATFAPGKVGQAFSFDGLDDYVVVPDSASLDLTEQFTLDAWINPSSLHSAPLDGAIISKIGGAAGDNGYQFGITGNNAVLLCQFNAAGEPWPGNQLIVDLPSATPLGQWSHVACTYDNADLKIYVNGGLVGTQPVGAKSVVDSASDLRISGDDNNHVYFHGLIDEVEIFNRALSADEITAIYGAGSLGKLKP